MFHDTTEGLSLEGSRPGQTMSCTASANESAPSSGLTQGGGPDGDVLPASSGAWTDSKLEEDGDPVM